MEVVVTGIGVISALGDRLSEAWIRLIAGETAIKLHQIFPELTPHPLALIGNTPAELKSLTRQAVTAAINDASLVPPLLDCGVVVGSSRGCQAEWERLAQQMYAANPPQPFLNQGGIFNHLPASDFPTPCLIDNSPQYRLICDNWWETLPNMAAIAAARQVGTSGIVLAPMAACATGIWAIAQACELIQTGLCQRAIAGAVDAAITPLTITGFNQMGALAPTGAYPFDKHRQGLVLGEAAVILVLESANLARGRGANIYGQILGFGLTNDGYHANAPNPDRRSAIAAVKQCLDRSKLSANDIDYIHAHGTGTRLNDQNEAHLIKYLFPQKVAVSSTKGATGHTLGASGALGVAFSLMALKHQILPPCVGLKEAEFDLNFVTVARQSNIRKILCLSFGFGGQNAAIALANFNH